MGDQDPIDPIGNYIERYYVGIDPAKRRSRKKKPAVVRPMFRCTWDSERCKFENVSERIVHHHVATKHLGNFDLVKSTYFCNFCEHEEPHKGHGLNRKRLGTIIDHETPSMLNIDSLSRGRLDHELRKCPGRNVKPGFQGAFVLSKFPGRWWAYDAQLGFYRYHYSQLSTGLQLVPFPCDNPPQDGYPEPAIESAEVCEAYYEKKKRIAIIEQELANCEDRARHRETVSIPSVNLQARIEQLRRELRELGYVGSTTSRSIAKHLIARQRVVYRVDPLSF
ncbi:hypothetical protein JCM3766R1_004515 [Sporobolomyces carnicolor]